MIEYQQLGPSLQPGNFLRIQYEVGGIGSIRLEIKICWDSSRCKQQQQKSTTTQVTAKTHQEVTKNPLQGRKKHQVSSKGLWRPSTSIGNTHHSGLQWASSLSKIARNIRKVPHVRQHCLRMDSLLEVLRSAGIWMGGWVGLSVGGWVGRFERGWVGDPKSQGGQFPPPPPPPVSLSNGLVHLLTPFPEPSVCNVHRSHTQAVAVPSAVSTQSGIFSSCLHAGCGCVNQRLCEGEVVLVSTRVRCWLYHPQG